MHCNRMVYVLNDHMPIYSINVRTLYTLQITQYATCNVHYAICNE